jgi:hypothetical protein
MLLNNIVVNPKNESAKWAHFAVRDAAQMLCVTADLQDVSPKFLCIPLHVSKQLQAPPCFFLTAID